MKRPEFGYHSEIAATADIEKWVEIDLGKDVELSSIVLHACHDEFAGIGAGFGFPVRYRIETTPSSGREQVGLQALCRMQRLRALLWADAGRGPLRRIGPLYSDCRDTAGAASERFYSGPGRS